jgi:hypothetical protein
MIAMIVKYKSDGMWNYIDNVGQAKESGLYFPDFLINQYEKAVIQGDTEDISGKEFSEEIQKINKAWMQACVIADAACGEMEFGATTENLITDECIKFNQPIGIVLIKRRGEHGYSKTLVTSQDVYLMNDEGKTIERLV